ncbi:MAG: hypothetical protein IJI97_11035 [Clostridia bacterium]|nr:hypothetical protein [Clostridia bacterium]
MGFVLPLFLFRRKEKAAQKEKPIGIMGQVWKQFVLNKVLWVQPFFQERLHVFMQNRSK